MHPGLKIPCSPSSLEQLEIGLCWGYRMALETSVYRNAIVEDVLIAKLHHVDYNYYKKYSRARF